MGGYPGESPQVPGGTLRDPGGDSWFFPRVIPQGIPSGVPLGISWGYPSGSPRGKDLSWKSGAPHSVHPEGG